MPRVNVVAPTAATSIGVKWIQVDATPSTSKYSATKFLQLDHFMKTASRWRVFKAIAMAPVPGLAMALLPSFIPLQDPLAREGLRGQPGFLLHAWLMIFMIFVNVLIQFRQCSALDTHLYTTRQLLAVTLVSTTVQYVLNVSLILLWTFPLPMVWVVGSTMMGLSLALGHIAVFGSRCWKDKDLQVAFQRYVTPFLFQCIQIVLYPAISVIFDRVTATWQVVLTLAFPVIKYIMKRVLRRLSRGLGDLETEVSVSGIEICASLYQSMIMQNSPSVFAVAVIMGIDILQGLAAVKLFIDRRVQQTPRHLIMQTAVAELLKERPPGDGKVIESIPPSLPTSAVVPEAKSATSKASSAVTQALHLVDIAESILLVEYFEVVIPIVNAIFLTVACQFSSTQYNMRLRWLYFHPEQQHRAILSILGYAALQFVSFMGMHYGMKHRYGVSATYHLAFVLETTGCRLSAAWLAGSRSSCTLR